MTLRISKPSFNIREKINEMDGVAEVRYQGSLIRKIEHTYFRIMEKLPYLASS